MNRRRRALALTCCVMFLAVSAHACEWDYDTLALERQEFPTVLELITGKFVRHSEEFYLWRIEDRTRRIERDGQNPALYDDLAVAYRKSGDYDKAIDTILRKEALFPGQYETYSNLGTFYIFRGDLEKSLEQISKALEINPNAHFGREIYQKLLVEYILSTRVGDDPHGEIALPLSTEVPRFHTGYFAFVQSKGRVPSNAHQAISADEHARALKGVLGMMRFADHKSPILLEALGDLLLARVEGSSLESWDAKNLAARAYLQASYSVNDAGARDAYRKIAERAIALQTSGDRSSNSRIGLEKLEQLFQAELKEADEWYAQVRADELQWIAEGLDVDAEFSRKYYQEPTLSSSIERQAFLSIFGREVSFAQLIAAMLIAGLLVAVLVCSAYLLIRNRRRTARGLIDR